MNTTGLTPLMLAVALANGQAFAAPSAPSPPPKFPLRPSADGRVLVDAAGKPFFYHADTAWTITKRLKPVEVDEYLYRRKAQGWNAIHVHTVSKEVGPATNRDGHDPFTPIDDILKPNEAYWRHVDYVVAAAESRNLLVAMSALWVRPGGKDKEGWRYQLTEKNARPYGRFLGKRFRRHKNLI